MRGEYPAFLQPNREYEHIAHDLKCRPCVEKSQRSSPLRMDLYVGLGKGRHGAESRLKNMIECLTQAQSIAVTIATRGFFTPLPASGNDDESD